MATLIGPGMSAMLAASGIIAASVVSLISASDEKDQFKRRILTFIAGVGLVVGGASSWIQYETAKTEEQRATNAESELEKTRKAAEAANVTLKDLDTLNALSPHAQYHVRLSVDSDPAHPCKVKRAIESTFPGSSDTKVVRVVEGAKTGTWDLLFGRSLTLSAAYLYGQLAVAHSLANGAPYIESDANPGHEINCATIL